MSQKSNVTENKANKITTWKKIVCFVCNFFQKVNFNKYLFSNYKFLFLTYGIISQKLKMSETTKDKEMEPYMTRKKFSKLFQKVCAYG